MEVFKFITASLTLKPSVVFFHVCISSARDSFVVLNRPIGGKSQKPVLFSFVEPFSGFVSRRTQGTSASNVVYFDFFSTGLALAEATGLPSAIIQDAARILEKVHKSKFVRFIAFVDPSK